MATTTISFSEGAAHSFGESPAHARGSGGVGSTSVSLGATYGAVTFRAGYWEPDCTNMGTTFGSGSYYNGNASATSYASDNCYRRSRITKTSTPDPGGGWPYTPATTSISETITTYGRGSRDSANDTSGSTGSGSHFVADVDLTESNASFVSRVDTALSTLWTFAGTYVDPDDPENTLPWTMTAELEFSQQYTQSDFLDDAVALFGECTPKTNTVSGSNLFLYDSDGAPDNTHGYDLNYPFSNHFDDQTDIPLVTTSALVTKNVAGSSYYYDSGYDQSGSPSAVPWLTLVISAVRYDAVRTQPALYTRETSYDAVRGDVTSKLMPPGTLSHWVIPSSADLVAITSGDFKRMSVGLITSYTQTTPDFPTPD